ncbi:hypothetical protein HK101_003892 [Irineochytrium annulatum]|nr:hypothetical protein HK101_003892 [Irineochytrium annulatum]
MGFMAGSVARGPWPLPYVFPAALRDLLATRGSARSRFKLVAAAWICVLVTYALLLDTCSSGGPEDDPNQQQRRVHSFFWPGCSLVPMSPRGGMHARAPGNAGADERDTRGGCERFRDMLGEDDDRGAKGDGESSPFDGIPKTILFVDANESLMDRPELLCAIESAMLRNPDHDVVLATQEPKYLRSRLMNLHLNEELAKAHKPSLRALSSQRLRLVSLQDDFSDYVADTPMHDLFWRIQGMDVPPELVARAFELAFLYKVGGVSMELDTVSVAGLTGHGAARWSEEGSKVPIMDTFLAGVRESELVSQIMRVMAKIDSP